MTTRQPGSAFPPPAAQPSFVDALTADMNELTTYIRTIEQCRTKEAEAIAGAEAVRDRIVTKLGAANFRRRAGG